MRDTTLNQSYNTTLSTADLHKSIESDFGIPFYSVPKCTYGVGFPCRKGGIITKQKN